MPFRPRKKKVRQAKFHRCSRCGSQVRRRSVRCKQCAEPQKRQMTRQRTEEGSRRIALRSRRRAVSIQGARARRDSGDRRAVDDSDPEVGFDVDLT